MCECMCDVLAPFTILSNSKKMHGAILRRLPAVSRPDHCSEANGEEHAKAYVFLSGNPQFWRSLDAECRHSGGVVGRALQLVGDRGELGLSV